MRLILMCVAMMLAALSASAQQNDSKFKDYAAYEEFVNSRMKTRDVVSLLKRLGGRDEYTPEQMAMTERQFHGIWLDDFDNYSVFNRKDLGGGFFQEARAYWNGSQYGYFYAFLHQREDALLVIQFTVNTRAEPILQKF